MQVVILAGGKGTRLQSIVSGIPKPMAPVHGRPFLTYLLDSIIPFKVTKFVFSVGYKKEVIQNYFGDHYHHIPIVYVTEDEPLGTGGALKNVFETIKWDEPAVVINGDTFLSLDYSKIIEAYFNSNGLLTIALKEVDNCSRYGGVILENGWVVGFKEKTNTLSGFINAGIYVCSPRLFESTELPSVFSFEQDFLTSYLKSIRPYGFVLKEAKFIDIGIPEDYQFFCDNWRAFIA